MPTNKQAFDSGKRAGIAIGRQEIRKEVLDYLQEKYMDPNVERGGERGEAILELTRELSKMMKVN